MGVIDQLLEQFAVAVWGMPLIVLLLGGGAYLLIRTRLTPYRMIPHAISLLRIKDEGTGPGHWSHAQALSTALAGTIGMGNIAGVAVAVKIGGPGAIFWMWVTAIIGIATKFFTGTLAVMYREEDEQGRLRAGPMYVIRLGLGPKFQFLAYLFCVAGLIGCLPALQVNQLVDTTRELILAPRDLDAAWMPLLIGVIAAIFVGLATAGGTDRIGALSIRLVPLMCGVYLVSVSIILMMNAGEVFPAFAEILRQAWTPDAAFGGGLLAVLITGVRRGLFSNEAGIGTEMLAHGVARTDEPVREGLVAMLGPIVDTLLVCTATALVLMVTGVVGESELSGASLTAQAFAVSFGEFGAILLYVLVLAFALSTMSSYWFYGAQCAVFLAGPRAENWYRYAYISLIVLIALLPINAAINLIDGMYALMAIPTMTATLILAPKVMEAFAVYQGKVRTKHE